jgi:hypothetical protein
LEWLPAGTCQPKKTTNTPAPITVNPMTTMVALLMNSAISCYPHARTLLIEQIVDETREPGLNQGFIRRSCEYRASGPLSPPACPMKGET